MINLDKHIEIAAGIVAGVEIILIIFVIYKIREERKKLNEAKKPIRKRRNKKQ